MSLTLIVGLGYLCCSLDTGHKKRSGKEQMEAHLDTLVGLMQSEWQQISRMAPSLKSGTGVMEEALLHKLHRVAKQANLLCMKDDSAAEAMIERIKRWASAKRSLLRCHDNNAM
jgi:hypothetical protein